MKLLAAFIVCLATGAQLSSSPAAQGPPTFQGLALPNAASAPPSFAGTWRSEKGRRLVISQDASTMVVTDQFAAATHLLNGDESRYETRTLAGDRWQNVTQSSWVGSALIVKGATAERAGRRPWQWMHVYTRNGSGQLLVTTISPVLNTNEFKPMAVETIVYNFESQ